MITVLIRCRGMGHAKGCKTSRAAERIGRRVARHERFGRARQLCGRRKEAVVWRRSCIEPRRGGRGHIWSGGHWTLSCIAVFDPTKWCVNALLLLLSKPTASGTCRRSNTQWILAVRQSNSSTFDHALERVAIEVVQCFCGALNIFKLSMPD